MRYLLLLISIAVCLSTPLSASLAMTSHANFTKEMQAHRKRLVNYAKILKNSYPQMFRQVSEQQIDLYFNLHDKPKVESLAELAKFGYQNSLTIGERLARFHGDNLQKLSPQESQELRETINALNEIERQEKADFFRRNRWSKSEISTLSFLERVVDITDVGLYRTQEMGLKPQLFDGAKYLRSKGEVVAAKLSEFLEEKIRSMANPNMLFCGKVLL